MCQGPDILTAYTTIGLEGSPVGLPRKAGRKSLPTSSDNPKKTSLLVRTIGSFSQLDIKATLQVPSLPGARKDSH
jgi:hypothetical protein